MTSSLTGIAERIAGALAEAGLPRLPARVFSALLVDPEGRMTSAELTAFLDVSPAGISGAVSYLTRVGIVHRERVPGSRRDVYVVDDDAWHGAMMSHDRVYAPIKAALDRALVDQSIDPQAHGRLRLTREFLTFLEAEFDEIGRRWERYKAGLTDLGH